MNGKKTIEAIEEMKHVVRNQRQILAGIIKAMRKECREICGESVEKCKHLIRLIELTDDIESIEKELVRAAIEFEKSNGLKDG